MTFAPQRSDIERFLGPTALPEWISAMAELSPVLCEHYGFTRLRWVHFMGQIAAETDGMSIRNMTENMNYTTASRIVQVFSYRLGLAIKRVSAGEVSEPKIAKGATVSRLAQSCVRQPVLLANIVYGGREGTPWMCGSQYLGRGPTQTTHLNNYRAAGNEVAKQPGGAKFDLVATPELLSDDPEIGVRVAFAEWHLKGLNVWADRDDVDTVSDVLNTGNANDNVKPHNADGRRRWVAKAKVVWPAVPTSEPETAASDAPTVKTAMLRRGDKGDAVLALQKRLVELGYHLGAQDGIYGVLTERAVRAFQSEHALDDDGIAGPKTLAAMKDSAPADLGPRETMTAKDLVVRGSRTASLTQRAKRLIAWVYGGTSIAAVADFSSGLGVIETVLTSAEQIKSFIARALVLSTGIPPQYGHYLVIGFGLTLVGALAWWAFDQIEKFRIGDAQSGANLGK